MNDREIIFNNVIFCRHFHSPSIKDSYFPTYRMKDWYLGNSWAGGIAMAYPNGRNQESSSESIAAYEGTL
jgi:endoglucanase Acf2